VLDVVPFAEVSDDFARAEGEGFAGHADWALAHCNFWQRSGVEVDDATAVVCVRFTLLPSERAKDQADDRSRTTERRQ
jgi:uncharacterized protein YhfF